ncbi:unnamed protein product [Coregonus sp. 'balchen']|nr:unnamed protein product [Coregonus sp. 'balchen']
MDFTTSAICRPWWSSVMAPFPVSAAALCPAPVFDEEYGWSVQRVPLILDRHTVHLRTPTFGGKTEGQSALPPPDWAALESMLGYETVYENGTRTQTDVTLQA